MRTYEKLLYQAVKQFSTSRDSKNRLEFQREIKKTAYLQKGDIIRMDNLFLVPSEADRTNMYIVDPQSGFCSCPIGKFGKFCKHQAGVSRSYKDVICNNVPSTTPQVRYEMAVLAFGSKARDISVYQALQYSDTQHTNEVQEGLALADEQPIPTMSINEHQDEDMKDVEKWVEKSIAVFREKFFQHGCSEKATKKFYTACKNISTRNALESLMFNCKRNTTHRSNDRIKVQTTSVARRKTVKRLKRK